MDLFDVPCSVYVDAHDNYGRYVDRETGEMIQQMTIREFCMTDRWKDVVNHLRSLIAQYGPKAKQTEEYKHTKEMLPGATLSGLFAIFEEQDERTGRTFYCSRRQTHLQQHTGFICIDIDRQDNQSLQSMNIVLRTLRHRPEVALCMKSCSGTGYFVLIPIAYPQYHKEQFAALMKEYAALGIVIDRKCGDVTRIRFASYDDNPYINPQALPYKGVELGQQMLAPRAAVYGQVERSEDDTIRKVERLVEKLEQYNIDIVSDYDTWIRVAMSLANLPPPYGKSFFHRVSRINTQKYNAALCEKKFDYNSNPQKISIAYFFARCKDHGVTLYN